jgi:hypothetical protein
MSLVSAQCVQERGRAAVSPSRLDFQEIRGLDALGAGVRLLPVIGGMAIADDPSADFAAAADAALAHLEAGLPL